MELHATILGDGPPVCLLHGLFGRAQNLSQLARRLAPHFRVVSLDLRNHGASPHAPGMAYAAMAADVVETLAARDALPAGLLGHSMGGKVAMMAALTVPAAVSRLVVADIAPVGYQHHNTRIAQALAALELSPGLTRGQADQALSPRVPDPAVRGFLLQNFLPGPCPSWRIGLHEIASGMAEIEGWPDLARGARYDGPALFLSAEKSDYVLPEHAPIIASLFPRVKQARVEKAGHWLHADQPEVFGMSVEAFFMQTASEAALG